MLCDIKTQEPKTVHLLHLSPIIRTDVCLSFLFPVVKNQLGLDCCQGTTRQDWWFPVELSLLSVKDCGVVCILYDSCLHVWDYNCVCTVWSGRGWAHMGALQFIIRVGEVSLPILPLWNLLVRNSRVLSLTICKNMTLKASMFSSKTPHFIRQVHCVYFKVMCNNNCGWRLGCAWKKLVLTKCHLTPEGWWL